MTLTALSATALARGIRNGEFSSRDVVEAHIAVLERVNPALNAVVAHRYAAARADADAADARIAAGKQDLPPLLGVPCTVKESIAVAGLPNTAGVVARRTIRPTADATVVQRLRDAGAIPLGVTNTAEACMWLESDNRVYGRTGSAYDPDRIAGGSSGGEGATVGCGGSPIGLGTDTVGSIRVPAFCNGVFGHRPSTGLIPITGAWPPPHGAARMCANGPLARRAEDLMPLLRILAGPDGHDPLTIDMPLPDPGEAARRTARSHHRGCLPARDQRRIARRPRTRRIGAGGGGRQDRPCERPILAPRSRIRPHQPKRHDRKDLPRHLADTDARTHCPDSCSRGRVQHTLPTRLLLLGEILSAAIPGSMVRRTLTAAHAMVEELNAVIGNGVLLHPTMQDVAPRHGATIGRLWWLNPAAPFSVAGIPVTQVPLGLDTTGLPLGVQVAATLGNDHRTIAVALELERAFGGWVAPRTTDGSFERA